MDQQHPNADIVDSNKLTGVEGGEKNSITSDVNLIPQQYVDSSTIPRMFSAPSTSTSSSSKKRDSEDDSDGPPSKVFRGSQGEKGKAYRFDHSLAALTDKFIMLVRESGCGVVDLNEAAEKLNVQKRRIYDITNVLEGIGLVLKKNKNHIEWRATGFTTPEELQALREEIARKKKEEENLDTQLVRIQNRLKRLAEEPSNLKNAFVTVDDVCQLRAMQGENLLVLKAPSGTKLEVPDPDEGMLHGQRRYQIFLKSCGDPIDVYLLDNSANEAWNNPSQAPDLMEMLNVGNSVNVDNTNTNNRDSLYRICPAPPVDDYYLTALGLSEGISDLYAREEVSYPNQ